MIELIDAAFVELLRAICIVIALSLAMTAVIRLSRINRRECIDHAYASALSASARIVAAGYVLWIALPGIWLPF